MSPFRFLRTTLTVIAAAGALCTGSGLRAAEVVINEVGPAFVELYNASETTVDLSGWSLAGEARFTFPGGTSIPCGGYLVVGADPLALRPQVPPETAVLGWEQGSLTGGTLQLFAAPAAGRALLDVVEASGELLHPELDNGKARMWRRPAKDGGTPGARNSRYTELPVVIEETPARGGWSADLREIAVTFSEEVADLAPSALTVNGAPAVAVRGSGAGPYVFTLSSVSSGLVRVSLESDAVASDAWQYLDTAILSMPDNAQGGPGSSVQVPISVAPGDGIFGVDMTLTYAAAVLQAQSVVVSGIAAAQGFALAANLGTPGTIVISEYAGQNGLVGSGEIARITFTVLGAPGTTSTLGWTSASINENGIPVGFDPGLFTVTCAGAANGTACNDGNPCTASDQCQGGVCTGTVPLQVPAEVAHLRFDADRVTLRWDSASGAGPGTVHDVLRGLVTQLPVGSGAGDICLASGVANEFTSDAAAPGGSSAFWYLVRGRNACGIGTYGFRTGGMERTSTTCP